MHGRIFFNIDIIVLEESKISLFVVKFQFSFFVRFMLYVKAYLIIILP